MSRSDDQRPAAIHVGAEGAVIEDAVFDNAATAISVEGAKNVELRHLGFQNNETDIYSENSQVNAEGLAFWGDDPWRPPRRSDDSGPHRSSSVLFSRKDPCMSKPKVSSEGGPHWGVLAEVA